jgi:hypothetical protein
LVIHIFSLHNEYRYFDPRPVKLRSITCATYYQIKSAENAKCSPRNDNLNLLLRAKFHWSWVRVAVLIVKTKNVEYYVAQVMYMYYMQISNNTVYALCYMKILVTTWNYYACHYSSLCVTCRFENVLY